MSIEQIELPQYNNPKPSGALLKTLIEKINLLIIAITGVFVIAEVQTDLVNEKTEGSGVTVSGVLLQNGQVSPTAIGNDADCGQLISARFDISESDLKIEDANDGSFKFNIINDRSLSLIGNSYAVEFVSAVLIYQFSGAAYEGGSDDLKITDTLGNVITAAITDTSFIGASENKIVQLNPKAGFIPITPGTGLQLYSSSPYSGETSHGSIQLHLQYRLHKTNLTD